MGSEMCIRDSCEACREDVVADPEFHLARIERYKSRDPSEVPVDDAFEVPEISEITPIEIQAVDEADTFEIEVPH